MAAGRRRPRRQQRRPRRSGRFRRARRGRRRAPARGGAPSARRAAGGGAAKKGRRRQVQRPRPPRARPPARQPDSASSPTRARARSRSDRHLGAVGGGHPLERPVGGRLDLDGHLVRLDLEQRLALRDRVALAPSASAATLPVSWAIPRAGMITSAGILAPSKRAESTTASATRGLLRFDVSSRSPGKPPATVYWPPAGDEQLLGREARDHLAAVGGDDELLLDPRRRPAVGRRPEGLEREHHALLDHLGVVEARRAG